MAQYYYSMNNNIIYSASGKSVNSPDVHLIKIILMAMLEDGSEKGDQLQGSV